MQKILSLNPIVPVITIEDLAHAKPLANALLEGGISIMEITLRTPTALSAIKLINQECPGITVGAGTIESVSSIQSAVEAGAKFLVSPGTTKPLLDAVHYHAIPLLPGVVTPTEVMALQDEGFQYVKFFPAEAAGGTAMLKALSGPFPNMKFCPTGGIDNTNLMDYLTLKNVVSVGSSWVVASDLIKNNNWSEITRRARDTLNLIKMRTNE